ncbi:MAG: peptidylprolyl isomerase [Candidatus Omnitrophica bacterium]|nr:peptidylprolyl isomerase [Candidatus Omnitrophota bacterium]
MLKQLRHRKTAKKIWVVLLVLILPAFVFWGLGSVMRSKKESSYLGKISGRQISPLEFKDALDAVRTQAIMQFGDNLSQIEKHLNLEAQAWERLILLAQAKKRRIKVSDEEVIAQIKSYPFFAGKDGFSQKIYSELLQYVFRTQPRVFEEQTRQNLLIKKLYESVTKNVNITEDDIRKEYIRLNEKISLYYISASASDFTGEIPAEEKEIEEYFSGQSFKFKQPLSFNLQYMILPSEDKEDDSLKQRLNQITGQMNKKEDILKIAEGLGLEVKETGLFSQNEAIPGIGWGNEEILKSLDNARPKDYLPVVKIDKDYYILLLKERKEPYIPDLTQIKDKVKEAYIKEKTQEIARQKMERCLEELKNAYQKDPKTVNFDKIAKNLGLKSGSTDAFQYGSYIEGIGSSDAFWTHGQQLKPDGFSDIIETASGLYIVKLKEKIPVDEKKFTEEKKDFGEKLLLDKKQEHFTQFFDSLKNKAGKPF